MRWIFAIAVFVAGCQSRLPEPPVMSKRVIAPTSGPVAGRTVAMVEGANKFTLFVPDAWKKPASGKARIAVHFHTIDWFTIQEHLRHGLGEPLVVFNAGEGSAVYRDAFKDPERFGRILKLVEGELGVHIVALDMTSCSAGYGAVREIVRRPEYWRMIRRLMLLDSMYAGWDETTTKPGATSRPAMENMEPWFDIAHAAARGELTFVITHSDVPTKYASSGACAAFLIETVGAKRVDVKKGSLPATMDPEFPLLYRADLKGFHLWGYGGQDGQAHLTHVRHLADVWKALDAAGVE